MNIDELVALVLFQSAQRNSNGSSISINNLFDQLNNQTDFKCYKKPISRSAISQSRDKLSWEVFPYLLEKINEKFNSKSNLLKFKDHKVYGVDGSWINVPCTEELKTFFPYRSKKNSGHYPKGKIVTALDVLSGIPKKAVFREEIFSEREGLRHFLNELGRGSVCLLDRGYEGFSTMKTISEEGYYFIQRMGTHKTCRKEIRQFIKSRKKDIIVEIKSGTEVLKVRLIKIKNSIHGAPIVVATNLLSKKKYSRKEIIALYYKRWSVESLYYQLKKLLNVENYHSKKLNGLLQEIWANLCVLAMSSGLILVENFENMKLKLTGKHLSPQKRYSLKNVVEILRQNFVWFVFELKNKKKYLEDFCINISKRIKNVYHHYQEERKNPRESKQPVTNWVGGRKNRAIDRYKGRQKAMNTKS